jgi:hypothetical protein
MCNMRALAQRYDARERRDASSANVRDGGSLAPHGESVTVDDSAGAYSMIRSE